MSFSSHRATPRVCAFLEMGADQSLCDICGVSRHLDGADPTHKRILTHAVPEPENALKVWNLLFPSRPFTGMASSVLGTSLPPFSLKRRSLSQHGASMHRNTVVLSPAVVAGSRPRPSVILPSWDCRDLLNRETLARRASYSQRSDLSTWYGRPRTLPLRTSYRHQSIVRVGD